jgi:hypothetical protein
VVSNLSEENICRHDESTAYLSLCNEEARYNLYLAGEDFLSAKTYWIISDNNHNKTSYP